MKAKLATQQRLSLPVSADVFTGTLDFEASFTGGQRFLEIGVRPACGSSFTTLNPPTISTPDAIRSLNAAFIFRSKISGLYFS